MKVKVKPAPKTAGKRSMKARQKRLVKRAAYILRGVCKSRNWDTACWGILRRADGRGRPLPDALLRALWYQIRRNRAVMEVARKNWERGAEKCMKTTSRMEG